jgi:hypothetical protein
MDEVSDCQLLHCNSPVGQRCDLTNSVSRYVAPALDFAR